MKLSEQLRIMATQFAENNPNIKQLGLLKSAGVEIKQARLQIAQEEMEKTASARLVDAGIDFDTALELVKSAGVKVEELPGFSSGPSEAEHLVELLTKAASQLEVLEGKISTLEQEETALLQKVASLEEILEEIPEQVEPIPDSLTKLAENGNFTSSDLEALGKVPVDTLKKLASMQNESSWAMGKGAGVDTTAMDPLTAFLLS